MLNVVTAPMLELLRDRHSSVFWMTCGSAVLKRDSLVALTEMVKL